ncbi:MAG TPA: Gfo/Idh/MocA family oxidoreductase [Afifellaceae bacterium]|nr:Gfo/Idh/MocA family oxidoreductase [Afifellaceae bacterium]
MSEKVRIGVIGIGWWSNVLAAGAQRTPNLEIVSCFTRSEDKRQAFASEFQCRACETYDELLADPELDGIINTTPNNVHLATTQQAADLGKHVFLDKPIATNVRDGLEITRICKDAGIVLAMGYQRRREAHFRWVKDKIDNSEFGIMVQAEANISRDREGAFEPGHWRFSAEGMPGGVMLQIGLHYVDVLEMLMGPVAEVSGMASQLVLKGDNPDVGSLLMKHRNGAISTLNTSYASASEHYVMNIYGREASGFFDDQQGLRHLVRGTDKETRIDVPKNDTIAEQLEEWGRAIRGEGEPEVGGAEGTQSLAVVLAGVKSVKEGRTVSVEEMYG